MLKQDPKRRFSDSDRADLFLASNGKCVDCGASLESGFDADHIIAHSKGGRTDALRNGQALCHPCNLKKSNKGEIIEPDFHRDRWPSFFREWQIEAGEAVLAEYRHERISIVNVCTGAGKTIFGLGLAKYFLDAGIVERVVIVSPTQPVRDGWMEVQYPDGEEPIIVLALQHKKNGDGAIENSDMHGLSLTYPQASIGYKQQWENCVNKKTLVIFDEIHHLGTDQQWGKGNMTAFDRAEILIGLTGTAWRDEGSPIPGTRYAGTDNELYCVFTYSLERGVREGINKSPRFIAIDGSLQIQPTHPELCCSPTSQTVKLSEERNAENKSTILNELLKPHGNWIPSVLRMADKALVDIRTGNDFCDPNKATKDAKGLVIVRDQYDAEQVQKQLEGMTGDKVALVISDNPKAKEEIDNFKKGKLGRWVVAVNMISEGVNIPAIHVVVYATNITTPVRFTQIVGRALRRRKGDFNRSALIFIPALEELTALAEKMEAPLLASFEQEIEEEAKRAKEEGEYDEEMFNEDDIEFDSENDIKNRYSSSEGELNSIIEPLCEGDKSITAKSFNLAMAWCEYHGLSTLQDWVLDVARRKFPNGNEWTHPNGSYPNNPYESQSPESKIKSPQDEWLDASRAYNDAAGRIAKKLRIDYDIMNGYLKQYFPNRKKMTKEQHQRAKDFVEHLKKSDIDELRKRQSWRDKDKREEI